MRIIGCDFHTRQQTVAMLDMETGELVKMILKHEGNNVREFYSKLPGPVRVGIEATGSMHWFVNLMEELGIECLVGHPAEIRAAEPRTQKHDRRDANLILRLLVENPLGPPVPVDGQIPTRGFHVAHRSLVVRGDSSILARRCRYKCETRKNEAAMVTASSSRAIYRSRVPIAFTRPVRAW